MSSISRRGILFGASSLLAAPLLKVKAFAQSIPLLDRSRTRVNALPKRYLNAVAGQRNFVYLTGGYSANVQIQGRHSIPTASVFLFDANSETASELPPMLEARARHASVVLEDGRLVVIGGMSLAALSSVEIYDPRTGKWTFGEPLSAPVYDHMAHAAGLKVIISGGQTGTPLTVVHIPPIGAPSWRNRP